MRETKPEMTAQSDPERLSSPATEAAMLSGSDIETMGKVESLDSSHLGKGTDQDLKLARQG